MATIESRPVIESPPRLFTVADLAELPSELPSGPVLYELDNGRLMTMPPPGADHCSFELRIAGALLYQGEYQGHGRAFVGETTLVLWRNPDRTVNMDAAFVAKESLPVKLSKEGYLETIPDLVVEIVSKNDSRPYVQRKVDDYLAAGVRVVWTAHPLARSLTEHRAGQPIKTFSTSDTLTLEDLIPGFALPLAKVFAP